jgi:uroporphyrinogen-III synthase
MEKRNFLITTRPAEKNRQTANAACFDIKNIPLTRIERKADLGQLKGQIEKYSPNFIVLTSSIGSEIFMKAGIVGSFKIMCIGKKTADPLLHSGHDVLIAGERNSTGLIELISRHSRKESRIALCRSKQHNTMLDGYLASEGYNYKCFDLYEIKELHPNDLGKYLSEEKCRGMIITSSYEAVSLAHLLGKGMLSMDFKKKNIFCIGKPTYETALEYGFKSEPLKNEGDVDAIVEEISRKHCNSGEWI